MKVKNINSTVQSLPLGEVGGASMNRRKFIQSFFRYSILGGILVLTGFILFKRRVTLESSCTENFACKTCKKYNKCEIKPPLTPPKEGNRLLNSKLS